MKYCPYCGAELNGEGSNYCAECGRELAPAPRDGKNREPKKQKRRKDQTPRSMIITTATTTTCCCDADAQREGVDKGLVKRIVLLTLMVAVVILLRCCAVPVVKSPPSSCNKANTRTRWRYEVLSRAMWSRARPSTSCASRTLAGSFSSPV